MKNAGFPIQNSLILNREPRSFGHSLFVFSTVFTTMLIFLGLYYHQK